MPLVLRVLHGPDPEGDPAPVTPFGAAGGRIGRHPSCTLVLPRSDRHVSRVHAEITCEGGVFVLAVLSRVNGLEVDGRGLPPGARCVLAGGEHLGIGGSLFRVELGQEGVLEAGVREPGRAGAASGPGPFGPAVPVPGGPASAVRSAPNPAVDPRDPLDDVFSELERDALAAARAGASPPGRAQAPVPRPAAVRPPPAALPEAGAPSAGADPASPDGFLAALGLASGFADSAQAGSSPGRGGASGAAVEGAFQAALDAPNETVLAAHLRAALGQALAVFSPAAVERRVRRTGALDGVLPVMHKARLWDAFVATHAELAHDAGAAFERAVADAVAERRCGRPQPARVPRR